MGHRYLAPSGDMMILRALRTQALLLATSLQLNVLFISFELCRKLRCKLSCKLLGPLDSTDALNDVVDVVLGVCDPGLDSLLELFVLDKSIILLY